MERTTSSGCAPDDRRPVRLSEDQRQPWPGVQGRAAASPKKAQGLLHLNNINAYHSRLKAWMDRFRGVASRTLANYLGGHRLLDAARQTLTPQEFLAASWG